MSLISTSIILTLALTSFWFYLRASRDTWKRCTPSTARASIQLSSLILRMSDGTLCTSSSPQFYERTQMSQIGSNEQPNLPYIIKEPSKQSTPTPSQQVSLPENDSERSEFPMADGLLDYFPNALAEVARHSKLAGDKHHPGESLHWERGKSTDHRNKIMRHLVDSGKRDAQGNRHTTGLAWRALALLQEELESEYGYPAPRNAR